MKKIIALLLVLVMCLGLFAACGPAYDVEAAGEFLYNSYVYDEGKETFKNYQLVGVVIVEGITYNVEWSSNSPDITFEKDSTGKLVTVKVPNPNATAFSYELTAKISAPNGTSVEKKFNRVMPVTEADVSTSMLQENVAYKLFVQQMNQNGQKFYALNTTQDNQNKFINTTNVPQDGVDFYVEAVDGGYKIFTDISGVKTYVYAKTTVSDDGKISKYIGFDATQGSVFFYDEERGGVWMVTIDGVDYGVGTYNSFTTLSLSEEGRFSTSSVGSTQFVMQFIKSSDANQLQPDEVPELNEDAAAVLNQLYALADGDSANGNFQLTGVITELDSYNNPTIVVTGFENKPVYCYRLSNDAFVVGATITVNATQMKNYGGTYEFMNCTLVSIVPPAGGSDPVDPPAGDDDTTETLVVVDAPVVGTAYKFGLLHGGKGNVDVFFDGQNYNNYAWYLNFGDATTAVDVYLETVEGVDNAYRLYFMKDSVKTYIVAFPRDGDTTKGTLKLDTVVPDTYFTYNTEYKTLIYTSATGEQFYLGSSGTYGSISVSAISYITNADSYVSHLYAAGTTEGGDPVDPPTGGDDGDDPVNPPAGDDDNTDMPAEFVVGNQYFIGFTNGGVSYWLDGTNAGGKNFRWNYTTDPYAAVKYTLESAGEDGKFYLTYTVGATKTYLNIKAVVSGTNTFYNLLAEATPVNAWEWNADINAFTVTVEDETVCVPKNYNGYTNVEAKAIDYTQGATYVLSLCEIPAETDESKAESVKNNLSIDTSFGTDAVIELPATSDSFDNITISWTMDGNAVSGTVTIAQTDAVQNVVFVATITCGDASVTKEFTVTVAAKVGEGGGTLATFEFGDNKNTTTHADGTDIGTGKTYSNNGYDLVITDAYKVYDGANDATGISALKFGTSKLNGTITFTVGADVDKVVIKVAQYKTNATTVSVNGTEYTITTASNSGAYTEIEIDTTSVKTITFATVGTTYRCMVDSISFVSLG